MKITIMKMKHGFLVLTMALFAVITQAQTPATFGIRAGVNFQNVNGENTNGDKLDNKIKTGFNAGITADIPVAPDFYFQPGLLYSAKGAKLENTDDGKLSLNYVELPLNFLYKPVLGTGKLLMGFGPYLAYGIGGKVENAGLEADVKFKKEAGNEANTVYYKPLDAGANLLFGYEFSNKVSAQLNAQLGLVNINAYDNDAKYKNTGFGVSLGYKF
ncbi:MAG TPA: porin family protein [Chitinophagaceae bacterium]